MQGEEDERQDGQHRVPAKLRNKLYRRLVAQPYEAITSWLRQRTERAGVDDVDHEALALVMVESMSAYRGMRGISAGYRATSTTSGSW
jgi:hypothetical protein